MTGERICIATLDPRIGGGVRTVTNFTYRTAAKAGMDPYLVYNALDWSACQTAPDVLHGRFSPSVNQERIDEMEGIRVGRVLPELEFGNYIWNSTAWTDAITEADGLLAVGGTSLPAIPLVRSDKPFGVWFGTTVKEERDVQRPSFSVLERLRDTITRPLFYRYERRVIERANPLLVQSAYTKRTIVDRHSVDPDDVEVLPVPVDVERFQPGNADPSSGEIVFVGRFSDPRKDIMTLLSAFASVQDAIDDAHLTLVGDRLSEEQRGRVEELGIADAVTVVGSVDDVRPYLQRAAIFALPSRQEGLGIAGLEAMSTGTPVVATRCGGPEDYVIDGETGFLVDVGNTDAFTDRLIRLLNDDGLRRACGNRARDLIENRYAPEPVRDRLTDAMAALVESRTNKEA